MPLYFNHLGQCREIKVKIAAYAQDKNLAIVLYSEAELGFEPLCKLTVNVPGVRPMNCALVDTNAAVDGICEWVEQYGLAVPTGLYVRSGFCEYPEYQFNQEMLRELDAEGYADYLELISQQDQD